MPSDLQVTNIKANDGTAGITIADSTGRVTVTDTNPTITLGANTTFPAGHIVAYKKAVASGSSLSTSSSTFSEVSSSLRITHTGGSGNFFIFEFSSNCGDMASNQGFINVADQSNITTQLCAKNMCDFRRIRMAPFSCKGTISASTSSVVYTPIMRNGDNSTAFNVVNVGTASEIIFTLIEIKG